MEALRGWWALRPPRERLVLGGGGVGVVVVLYLGLVLLPVEQANRQLREVVLRQRELAVWMEESAARLAVSGAPVVDSRVVVADLARQRLTANRLGESLVKLQPDGNSRCTLRLERANFSELLDFLTEMSRQYGIIAVHVTIERQAVVGKVTATLQLERRER